MKSFHEFLVEREMPVPDAMKILGLKSGFTADDLAKAHNTA